MGSQKRALCTSLHFTRLLKYKWSWRDGHLEQLEYLLSNPKQCSSEPSTHITNQASHRCLTLQFRGGRGQENQGGLPAFNLAKKTPTLGSGSDHLKGLDGKCGGKHQTPSSLSSVQVMRKKNYLKKVNHRSKEEQIEGIQPSSCHLGRNPESLRCNGSPVPPNYTPGSKLSLFNILKESPHVLYKDGIIIH